VPPNARRVESLLDRVLVIGATGQLGRELVSAFADASVLAPTHADLDVEEPDAVLSALRRLRPTLVLSAAAYHNVERCESYPERAFALNALAVDRLAAACSLVGAAFGTFSTDYVFDGAAREPYREHDRANPLSAYGASKLAGEQLARRHGERHFIVRTSGLYGHHHSSVKGPPFVERVLAQAESGEKVRVVDDVTFSPSYAPHVAAAVRRIVESGSFGTYHVTNAGATTWYEFAMAAFALSGLRAAIEPMSSSSLSGAARRPAYSALAHEAMARAGVPPMAPWREALESYVSARREGGGRAAR
jgi:dTDP-4-dehydrorhamnose reductase